jgi:hypothetical protein
MTICKKLNCLDLTGEGRTYNLMWIVCYLCNYLGVKFNNLFGSWVFLFNNGFVNHHQLVIVSINVDDSHTHEENLCTN